MSLSLKNTLRMSLAAAALLPALASHLSAADGNRPPGVVIVHAPGAPHPGGPQHPGGPVVIVPGPGHGPGPGPSPGHGPGPGPRPGGPGHPGFPILRPPVVIVGPRVPGHVYTPPPARDDDDDEVEVTRVMVGVMRGQACERAGDVLREMANVIGRGATFAARPAGFQPGHAMIVRRGEPVEYARQRWNQHLNSQRFWQIVWARLAQMYRECNRGCFDDGVAVGQISAAGYCAASVAVGGLNAPGFEAQKPLPLCQNETFTGCLVGYDSAAKAYDGCSTYFTGGYTDIYNQSKSQDCHMD